MNYDPDKQRTQVPPTNKGISAAAAPKKGAEYSTEVRPISGAAAPTATYLDARGFTVSGPLFVGLSAVSQAPAAMNALIAGEIFGD
tara:strand:- start:117 stop:374 length:258 start_codon:yes stop_codon:yes gene_type:complete